MESNFNEKDKKVLTVIIDQSTLIGEIYGSLSDLKVVLDSKKPPVKKIQLEQAKNVVDRLLQKIKSMENRDKI